MAEPSPNGATPEASTDQQAAAQQAAAEQARIEAYITQLVDGRVQLALQAQAPQAQQPVGQQPAVEIIKQVVAQLPAIATAAVSAINAFTQAKIMSNPLGHLEIIANNYPRLMALYSPNPLGDQFVNIFGAAFTQGMRVGSSAKAGVQTPLAPGAPAPLPNPSGNPSIGQPAALPASPGSIPFSDGDQGGWNQMSDEQFTMVLASVQGEYRRRHTLVS